MILKTKYRHDRNLIIDWPGMGGSLSCEGIEITKISPSVFNLAVTLIPEELADVLEGQELVSIRMPV